MTQSVVVTHVLRSEPPIVFSGQTIKGKTARFVDERRVLGRVPMIGETWDVTGIWQEHPSHGRQVSVRQAMPSRPIGRLFIQTVTGHSAFPGIGTAKAQRLWDLHGENIYVLLDAGDPTAFASTLDPDLAETLVSGWQTLRCDSVTYRWLDSFDLPPVLGEKIIAIYSNLPVPAAYAEEAKEVGVPIWHVQRDPYRMLSFATWSTVDDAARRMGVTDDDTRRCVGAIEAALLKRLQSNHTWTSVEHLCKTASRLLGGKIGLVRNAIADAVNIGAIVPIGGGFVLSGCEIMERYCADRILSMVAGKYSDPQLNLRRQWKQFEVEAELDVFEEVEGFTLNAEQRQSVHAALHHPASLLVGGPGVGKTTVLKAIHHVAEKMEIVVSQSALSGRAAQRMKEATGRSASTIANLLTRVDQGEVRLGDGTLLILDESSMIDLGTFYRLASHFRPGCRLLMVGDTGQLPPIGFGLTFHVLADDPKVPKTELSKVMRQSAESGIPQVCAAIRFGQPPELLTGFSKRDGVAFLDAKPEEVGERVMDLLAGLGGIGSAQIISSVKRGSSGTFEFNRQLQALIGVGKPLLCGRFFPGEPIIATRNDYDIGIMNGDLGIVMTETADHELEADFSGRKIIIPRSYLQNIDLAYAITCHKSQGSQFERVIIPIAQSRLLDRNLLLTAVSRGQKQVFLVGDRSVFNEAVCSLPLSSQRQVGFRHQLTLMTV